LEQLVARKSHHRSGVERREAKPPPQKPWRPSRGFAQIEWSRNLTLQLAALVVVALAGALVPFAPTVKAIFSNSTLGRIVYTDDLNDAGVQLREHATVTGDVAANEFGLAIAPGRHFEVLCKGTNDEGELPFVRIWMYGGEVADNRVTFRSGGASETLKIVGGAQSLVVRPQKLTPGAREFEVLISTALPQVRLQEPVLILDRIEVGVRVFGKGEPQQGFWSAFPAALWPCLGFLLLAARGISQRKALIIAAASAVVVAFTGVVWAPAMAIFAAGFVGVALVNWGWMSWRDPATRSWKGGVDGFVLAVALLSVAWALRWQWLWAFRDAQVQPDADFFQSIARQMKLPYGTASREPFHIWVIWLFSKLTGWSPLTLRLSTVVASLAEGALLFALAGKYVRRPFAVLVLALYALNPALATSAPMGLREEVLPAALLLFLVACIGARDNPRSWKLHVMIVCGAAAAVLTRFNTLSVVVPVYVAFAGLDRWPRSRIMAGAAALAALVLPHLIHNKMQYNDWLESNNVHAVFWRNAEFAGRPGFISREEFLKNGYAGEPVTVAQYFFKMHTPVEVTTGTLTGFWRMTFGTKAREELLRIGWAVQVDDFLNPAAPTSGPNVFEWLVFAVFVVGLGACWRLRNGWALPVTIFLIELSVAFIAGWFPAMRGTRLFMNHTMLMLLLAGIGAQFCYDLARAKLTRR
jgi:hypothetical protein